MTTAIVDNNQRKQTMSERTKLFSDKELRILLTWLKDTDELGWFVKEMEKDMDERIGKRMAKVNQLREEKNK